MIDYIIGIIAILTFYGGIKFFNLKRQAKNCKLIKGAEPFFYKKGSKGILLLHGFSSTPHDFRDLGKYLQKKNITVLAPLMKGHGTCVEEMALTKKEDWIKSAEDALLKLKKECKKVYLTGISLSGNICAILSARHKVNGIIFQGSPIFFKKQKWIDISFVVLPFLKQIKFFHKKWYQRDMPKKLKENRITYDKIALSSALEALRIIEQTKKILHKITCPALIMQTKTDVQIRNDSPQYIYDHISSKKKKKKYFGCLLHIMSLL